MISTGGHLTILESVDSTNNYAMARVRTGLANHGDAFFAMAQVQGKGQRGKTWVTERGSNIIITLVMRPQGLQLQQQPRFNIAVALAVHDFYTQYAGDETTIKWPNDIYWRDRKAGGILIESIVGSRESGEGSGEWGMARGGEEDNLQNAADSDHDGSEPLSESSHVSRLTPDDELLSKSTHDSRLTTHAWSWSIIGIGININQTVFPDNIRNPVSLKQITGKDWDVIELATVLCDCVQRRYTQLLAGHDLLPEYNNRLYKKGQVVKFKKDSRVFEGLVKEVNARGELLVHTSIDEYFSFGEVEWVLP